MSKREGCCLLYCQSSCAKRVISAAPQTPLFQERSRRGAYHASHQGGSAQRQNLSSRRTLTRAPRVFQRAASARVAMSLGQHCLARRWNPRLLRTVRSTRTFFYHFSWLSPLLANSGHTTTSSRPCATRRSFGPTATRRLERLADNDRIALDQHLSFVLQSHVR
jgi:hypothetical protein